MKKFLLFIFIFLIFNISSAFAAGCATSGSCYWVGGTGNWSDTTHWATSSGGATTGSVPTSTDDAIFDANSNATAYTITIDSTANCKNLNFSAAPSSGTITYAGSLNVTLSIFGGLTLLSGMSVTRNNGITAFKATSGINTIMSNGVDFTSTSIQFNGAGGTWQLQDNFSIQGQSLSLVNGTLDLNGHTATVRSFSSTGALIRVLTFGSGTLSQSGVSSSLTFSGSGLTINGQATGSITMPTASGGTFAGGGFSFPQLIMTGTNGSTTITGANTFANLTYIGPGNTSGQLILGANQTVTGTFTINSNSVQNRVWVKSDTLGTTRTITAATVMIDNTDFQDITGAGAAAPFTGTSVGDTLGNSGITFTAPVTRYWVATSSGNWSATTSWAASSGGASGATMPLSQDTVIFDANSITSTGRTVNIDVPRLGKNITMTTLPNAPTVTFSSFGSIYIFGSWTLSSSSAVVFGSSSGSLNFQGRSATTFTRGISSFSGSFTVSTFGGSLTLSDGLNTIGTGVIALTDGTLNLNNFDLTAQGINNGGSNTRTLNMGSGTFTANGVNGSNTWAMNATGLTFNAGTSTIKFTDSSTTGLSFFGGGLIYNNVWFARGASTGTITITGSNTFNDFKDTGTAAHTIAFTAGTTQTLVYWHVSGTPGNLISINSSTTATYSLVSLGGPVSADYLNIQHSVATPTALTWYAGANSTNNQGVATGGSGWIFTAAPVGTKQFGGGATVLNNMVIN